MYELYCLVDPTDNKIRYIGYTKRSTLRLNEHINTAFNINKSERNSYKSKWIRKLSKNDMIPIYKILLRSNFEEEIKQLEIDHIKYYKQYYKLVNGTLGGDGTSGRTPTLKERQNLSIKYTGIIRPERRYKVEALHTKTLEYKIFNDKTEAAKYIGCKENAIMSVSCGNRKKVYNWHVSLIKKGGKLLQ